MQNVVAAAVILGIISLAVFGFVMVLLHSRSRGTVMVRDRQRILAGSLLMLFGIPGVVAMILTLYFGGGYSSVPIGVVGAVLTVIGARLATEGMGRKDEAGIAASPRKGP